MALRGVLLQRPKCDSEVQKGAPSEQAPGSLMGQAANLGEPRGAWALLFNSGFFKEKVVRTNNPTLACTRAYVACSCVAETRTHSMRMWTM